MCAAICDWTADNAADELADGNRALDGGRAIVSYQPVGIIFGIQPFNFPVYQAMRYSIPQPKDLFRVLKISNDQSNELISDPLVRGVTLAKGHRDERPARLVDRSRPDGREDLRDDLHEQVTKSVDAGAKLTLGGEIPDRQGFFYPVTVLEDVQPGMPAYDEELFGPVASIIRVADDDEAMRVANDSRFGLGGGIISKNVDRAIDMAVNEFDTGMVNINGYNLAVPNLPFGGVKDSGYGREHGGFGIKEFVNIKSVQVTE